MNFLDWYDRIQPTNPYASLFFGVIFTIVTGLIAWFDTKRIRTSVLIIVGGLSFTVNGIIILNVFGYYG